MIRSKGKLEKWKKIFMICKLNFKPKIKSSKPREIAQIFYRKKLINSWNTKRVLSNKNNSNIVLKVSIVLET